VVIPRRLRLQNFLSYRDCTVDFTGLHLAVLSGANGNGKSALLDSMTWALWGEARGKYEDDRITHDQSTMLVDFEFEVDGDRFQVIRKRTRGKASGNVDFFHLTDGGSIALTGGTITETQKEITRQLRMDYDTFVNSAFIAQGRSDEFTRKRPAERKEVLGKVLGLERYEELATRANDRRKEAVALLKSVEQNVAAAREEVEQIPAKQDELDAVAREVEDLAPQIKEADETVAALRTEADAYRRLEDALAGARRRLEQAARALESTGAALADDRRKMAEAQATLSRRDEVVEAHAKLKALREQEHALAALAQQARTLEKEIEAAEREVAEEQARLEAHLEGARRASTECAEKAGALPSLRQQAASLEKTRDSLEQLRKTVEEARLSEGHLREEAAAKAAKAQQKEAQAREIKAKEKQLEGAATCPVCRKPLGPGEAEHVRLEYAAQRKALGDQYEAAQAAARKATAEAERLSKLAARGQEEAGSIERKLRQEENALASKVAEAERATQELPSLQAAVAETEAVLAAGSFAAEARARRAKAAAALEQIGYSPAAHDQLRAAIRAMGAVEDDFRRLSVAEREAEMLEENICRHQQQLEEQRRAAARCEAEVKACEEALEGHEDAGPRLTEAQEHLAALRERHNELTLDRGRLQASLENLKKLQAKLEESADDIRSLKEEEGVFEDLAKAFGRNGVQAMIIDQSIPRIEATANGLLERMTGGRIRVALATRRQNKGGGMADTLDIQISDDLGTRDYAMYSGGEAFRVDFALRIALARVLAERSGASLPTLIVDEGFGTQDQEGIDRLVEALNAISSEFRLILVVTHLDALRERFERRIEVTKDLRRGSVARVV
jgi:exonuclease SbcC